MIEKKFDKKINELTLEEQKRKDACWEKIEKETGINFEKRTFPKKQFYVLVSCCVVICIILPIVLFNIFGKKQEDVIRFSDTQYIVSAAECNINSFSESDRNVLKHNLYVLDNSTMYYIDANDNSKKLGICETGYDLTTKDKISITILFKNIAFDLIEGIREGMELREVCDGIELYYKMTDNSNFTYFKYNGYTYFVECYNPSSDVITLEIAKDFISSK